MMPIRFDYRELRTSDWLLIAGFVAVLLGCGGGGGSGSNDPTPSATASGSAGAALLEIVFPPTPLTFAHTVGSTLCTDGTPDVGQQIGSVTINNVSDANADVTCSGSGNIVFQPANTTVGPGASTAVPLFFDCGTTSSFVGSASCTVDNGSDNVTKSVIINATISGVP
jgi:hypothetical protein